MALLLSEGTDDQGTDTMPASALQATIPFAGLLAVLPGLDRAACFAISRK